MRASSGIPSDSATLVPGALAKLERTWGRVFRITARTAHIGSASLVLGAAVFGGVVPYAAPILLFSGCAIVMHDVHKHGWDNFRYVHGAAVLVKLGLVTLGVARPSLLVPSLWAALIVGSVISHAPGAIRQYPLWGAPGPCARK